MKKSNIKLITIIILLIVIFIFIRNNNNRKEGFESNFNSLENVDLMNEKIDNLVDTEKETRLFCKILRNDKSSKEQNIKILEMRNKQFQEIIDKQNKMINDIKKKIIEIKLDKDNKEIYDFNNTKNNKIEGNKKREELINIAKSKLKEGSQVNLSIGNNF